MEIRWYLMLMSLLVHLSVETNDRLVVNTTCLKLAKPSNQHLRLSCDESEYYHCLLDESSTREFEVCREWKWIPEGDCGYFNSFGQGNIDRRECKPNNNLTCSPKQYPSYENSKYTACYDKKYSDTNGHRKTTSLSQVTGTYDRENSTLSPGKSKELSQVRMQVLHSVIGIVVPSLSICVISFVLFIHAKRLHHCKEDTESSTWKNVDSKHAQTPKGDAYSPEQEPLMTTENTFRLLPKSDADKNGKCEEEESFEENSTSPFTTPSMLSKESEDADNTSKCKEEKNFSTPISNPSMIRKESEEDPESDNASDAESVEVFDDTMESLTTKVQTTDEKEIELRQELYHLLEEGLELTQEVLQLVITSAFDKTPEELVSDNTIKTILKNIMPEESHRHLSSQTESRTSINVLYGLIQLYPGMEPQSGWGEPVKGSDTGISDDVERLYRIRSIFKEISNPILISVENYVRLLNIMLTAVTSLDCDGKLEDKYEVLAGKLEKISNPNWSQFLFKKFNGFIKQWKI